MPETLNGLIERVTYHNPENVTARVKRWRDGDMRKRWCTAGLLRAESKFRRVNGYRHMSRLLKALESIVLGKGLDENRKVA